jgi:hypothetical protein
MNHPVQQLPCFRVCARLDAEFGFIFQFVKDPAQDPFCAGADEGSDEFGAIVGVCYGRPVCGESNDACRLADLLV